MTDKKTPAHSRLAQPKKKGFTLTEIAIVLGIIGLILAAIWTAASSVYSNNRLQQANVELLQIAQATRTMFATQSSFGTSNGADLTTALASAGNLSTAYTQTAGKITHPWNGNSGVPAGDGLVFVTADTISTTDDAFDVEFANIPGGACVALLTTAAGVTGYNGYSTATASTTAPSSAPSAPTSAITATTGTPAAAAVATACGGTGYYNTLRLEFTKG